MESQTLAALDSLAAKLVPQLPEATRVGLERAARYYVVQAVAVDVMLLLAGFAAMEVAKRLFKKYSKECENSNYGAEPWLVAGSISAVAAAGLFICAACSLTNDAPLFVDPMTATVMRMLGK